MEVENEEEQTDSMVDNTFGIGAAFHQLSEADKERMEEVGKIEAMLAQAKSECSGVAQQGRQPAAALWGGLTEEDINLYEEGAMVSPFYCNICLQHRLSELGRTRYAPQGEASYKESDQLVHIIVILLLSLQIQIHSENRRGKAKSMVWSKTWACSAVRSVE